MSVEYVPLNCKSCYSFLQGASHPHELLAEAHRLGISGLALVDQDGVYGMVRAHLAARKHGLHLQVGATVSIQGRSDVILLAKNRTGYANLCHLLTLGRRRSLKGQSVVSLPEACEHAKGLIAIASPCAELKEAFTNCLYAPISRYRHPKDACYERQQRQLARTFDVPLVAVNEVLYHNHSRQPLHDILTCIRYGKKLQEIGTKICPNAEHRLLSKDEFHNLFSDDPKAVTNTCRIAEQCSYSLDQIEYRYPEEQSTGTNECVERLRTLSIQGLHHRFGPSPKQELCAQLHKELSLIQELAYGGYFLTIYEIVQFCQKNNILCQGRGSAANSIVCFCLGITAVHPEEIDLLFERFLSRERAEPPDIDLDIEHNRREEVIQHVYEKYGREHAAMVCNFIRYRPKSAVRDVGKALGISEVILAQASKLLSRCATVEPDILIEAGLCEDSPALTNLHSLANELLGFPRHLSIHPGGFLLGRDPVHRIVPIENGSMPNRTVIQWDKDDIEALGLFKVDLLGLGALHQIHLCFDLINKHHGRKLELRNIPTEDEETYAMMRRADTIGVFQIESRAQMAMLPRLKPRTFYDLVIEISIIRPGPISGGMVHPFLRRRNKEEEVTYPHELLRPVLQKTLGVPLFQEQVMKVAMVAADYTPGEADQLRRDMAAWRQKGNIENHRDRLITRMCEKGISLEFANRIFEQICGFGEYGFPESHAASFARLAYITSWLKWHYPAEFACSLLNAQPMGFYSPATIVGDAQRHGVHVLPIDVNKSDWHCTLEPSERDEKCVFLALRMGFRYIKGLREEEANKIVRTRQHRRFRSIEEFQQRTQFSHKARIALAEAGAFDCFDGGPDGGRRQTLWQAYGLKHFKQDAFSFAQAEPMPSFSPLSELESIVWDFQSSHHSVKGHLVGALRPQLDALGFPKANAVLCMEDGSTTQYAGLVICRQRPMTAKGVTFMTLEDETGFVNLVIWLHVFQAHQTIAKTASLLAVSGTIQNHEGVVHLVADTLWQPSFVSSVQFEERSRDFH